MLGRFESTILSQPRPTFQPKKIIWKSVDLTEKVKFVPYEINFSIQIYSDSDVSPNTSIGKTEYVHISHRKEEFDVYVEDRKLYQANFSKYLGMDVDRWNIQITELKARIDKYRRNLMVIHALLIGECISKQNKISMYATKLKPTLRNIRSWMLVTYK